MANEANGTKRCPECGKTYGRCPECGKKFEHGTASRCDEAACVAVNAPIDCVCGLVVANNTKGVLNFEMKFFPWK